MINIPICWRYGATFLVVKKWTAFGAPSTQSVANRGNFPHMSTDCRKTFRTFSIRSRSIVML